MSFFRHEEIYRSDVSPAYSWEERQLNLAASVLIGCDEFPVGYSLAGCPPAEPASALPTGNDSKQSTLPYNHFSAYGNYPLNFVSQSKGALHTLQHLSLAPFKLHKARVRRASGFLLTVLSKARQSVVAARTPSRMRASDKTLA
jgi:hypothetical protein